MDGLQNQLWIAPALGPDGAIYAEPRTMRGLAVAATRVAVNAEAVPTNARGSAFDTKAFEVTVVPVVAVVVDAK